MADSAPPPAPDLFSVSRRFDMATILVAMSGYALLFGLLSLFNTEPKVIGGAGVLFALVAVAQAVAIRWGVPRAASIISGVLFWIGVAIWLALMEGLPVHATAVALAMIGVILLGPVTGYVAGVLVGSVFLIAHHLRQARTMRRRAPPPDDDEA